MQAFGSKKTKNKQALIQLHYNILPSISLQTIRHPGPVFEKKKKKICSKHGTRATMSNPITQPYATTASPCLQDK
jgi:hypothetical protein